MNRSLCVRMLVVVAFAVGLGAATTSPVIAGCKICGGLPPNCWDAGAGTPGKTGCTIGSGVCQTYGSTCTGGGGYTDPENIVQGGCDRVESGGVCEPFKIRMVTPEATMQLARSLPEAVWPQNQGQVAEVA